MSFKRLGVVALLTLSFAFTSRAEAGRRAFLFTWDTEAMNKGDVEVESWLWGKLQTEAASPADPATAITAPGSAWLWVSPIYGLGDHVEIAFPWEAQTGSPAGTRITNFTAEARIRAYDPLDEERLVRNLIRVGYQQNFNHPDNVGLPQFTPWIHVNVVTSIGDIKGSHGTLDVGGQLAMFFAGSFALRQTVGLGYTHKVHDEWRISAEYFHELNFGGSPSMVRPNGDNIYHFYAGPSVGFTRGRVWATLGAMIGLTPATPRLMPRFLFAIAI
jgi:hypothetical protein